MPDECPPQQVNRLAGLGFPHLRELLAVSVLAADCVVDFSAYHLSTLQVTSPRHPRPSPDALSYAVKRFDVFVEAPTDSVAVGGLIKRLATIGDLLKRFERLPATRRRLNRSIVVEAGRSTEGLRGEASTQPDLLPIANAAARSFMEATTALADLDYDAARIFPVASVVDPPGC